MRLSKNFLLGIFLIASIFLSLGIVSAWVDCYLYSAQAGGTPESCVTEGCVVTSLTGSAVGVAEEDVVFDSMCNSDSYCCLPKMCWQWDNTSESTCTTNDETLNCTWDSYPATWTMMDGTSVSVNGTCHGDWGAMDDFDDFGGSADGCWQYDGDRGQCANSENQASCSWKENDANQNSWCWIKTLGDALMENSLATSNDIGCCEQKGCWTFDGDEAQCANGAFSGLCEYMNKTDDAWCPNEDGCCYTKMCEQFGDNDTLCNASKFQMMMPCVWNEGESSCENMAGGGFDFFSDDSDSCFNMGGWFNSTGDCIMPTGIDNLGGGDFMFAGDAHCWFADNQPKVCGNITGCAYCVAGTGISGIENSSSICNGRAVNLCEGHYIGDTGVECLDANNTANLACTNIQIRSACNYGPLPNCVWNNNSAITGAYCSAGASSVVKAIPPVGFCEHPDSKNNFSLCTRLIEEFMMPCTWDNTSTIVKNCTFNSGAVFGSSGETDIATVGSEIACTASGGTWQTEYYVESSILKQDSWCEMTGFFDVDEGGQEANKANCDTSC